MVELYSGFFFMLRLAKRLVDTGLADKLQGSFRSLVLDEDFYYGLAYEAISVVFEDTFQDYNEDRMMSIYVFCDPLIDRFCRLCWKYEQRLRMTEDENPYRKEMERVIRSGFELEGYDYGFDWRFSASDRGRRRLLFFYGEEFCDLDDLPEGLLEIHEGFREVNMKLEKALTGLTREEKEVA